MLRFKIVFIKDPIYIFFHLRASKEFFKYNYADIQQYLYYNTETQQEFMYSPVLSQTFIYTKLLKKLFRRNFERLNL
jgi:hypothetical protein